jgi:hypothetical protein
MVKCAGGGWLDPGRPLVCLGGAHKFATAFAAFQAATAAKWAYDIPTTEHRCPQHQTGPGHVHYFKKTGSIKACVCGETITVSGS